jgi:hypothetical protein
VIAEPFIEALRGKAVRAGNERELNEVVADLFRAAGLSFASEYRLNPKDRVDFFMAGLGIELKTDGSVSALLRQLDRYAASDEIKELLLISTRRKLCLLGVDELRGKPITTFCLGGY